MTVLCYWPHPSCKCPECVEELAQAFDRAGVMFNDRSAATDIEFARAVAPFYDDTEPTIDSNYWDRDN